MSMLVAAPSWAAPYTSLTSTVKNNLSVGGGLTLGTPLTIANVNSAIESKFHNVCIGPGTALADSTVYYALVTPGRACTVTKITIGANIVPVGGTNTVAIQKNGTTTLLSAATFDPTTIAAANTGQSLALTATAASRVLAAGDSILVTWTAGVQTTDCRAPVVVIEVDNTADY